MRQRLFIPDLISILLTLDISQHYSRLEDNPPLTPQPALPP